MNDEMISEMTLAKEKYELAVDTGIGVVTAKERMMKIAFTYYGEILEMAAKNKKLEEQIAMLNVALEDSDRELSRLKKKKAPEQARDE